MTQHDIYNVLILHSSLWILKFFILFLQVAYYAIVLICIDENDKKQSHDDILFLIELSLNLLP